METAYQDSETRLESLTPSAKFVYTVLDYEGPLTQKALAERTRLSQRSVRSALADLADADLVEERVHPQDARQRLYTVRDRTDGD
ncbi:MarR family transcriptional regulator [Halobacteriales archaeon QH_7_68_42]|nr:MAG: MarR family transcriptional regulator [Halobacteriales archaeon QH_7_68_42]